MADVEPKTIEETLADLDEDYTEWKDREAKVKSGKQVFFDFCTEQCQDDLAEKLVEMQWFADEPETDVLERIERHNPGWTVDAHRDVENGNGVYGVEAILIEDPAFKSYTYFSEQGRVFHRMAVSGSIKVDDEFMRLDNESLYEEITFALPWGERVMPPVETLDAKQAAQIQKYLYRGTGKIQFKAPRDVKPEELVGE